jgi:tetratricopeptide (TPR) repeat protein
MGKKKGKNQEDLKNPEALKDLGNKSFALRHFDEAIKQYTSAIELSEKSPNHIYFANRANGYLETN